MAALFCAIMWRMSTKPRILKVEDNEFSYVGNFSRPALSLWSEGAKIFDGLLTAFAPYELELADIRVDVATQSPAGQIVTADLDWLGRYRFKFDGVECIARDLDEEGISSFPSVLQRGDDWLRSAVPDLEFKSHTLAHTSHSILSEGTSQEYLSSFPGRDIPGIGTNLGSGIFYHWDVPSMDWRVHLVIDHSLSVKDGIFVQMAIEVNTNKINFETVAIRGRALLESALGKIGLEFEKEVE